MMALKAMYMVVIDILVAPMVALIAIVEVIVNKKPMVAYLEGLKLAMDQQLKWVAGKN